jgi:hypothetical protein
METNELKQLVEALSDLKHQQIYEDVSILLLDKLDQVTKMRNTMESESTDLIATAFAEAQLEYPAYIGPNRDGFYLKSAFTDIPALRRALFPVLAKHGLSFRQYTRRDANGLLTLHSVLSHSSGQYFGSSDTITPENATLRSYGATKKYVRRQQMMALLQCDPFSDAEDDDGETQHKDIADEPLERMQPSVDLKKHTYLTITPEQIDQIEMELDGWPDLAKKLFKTFEISRVADMKRSQYDTAFRQLLEIKASMRKGK